MANQDRHSQSRHSRPQHSGETSQADFEAQLRRLYRSEEETQPEGDFTEEEVFSGEEAPLAPAEYDEELPVGEEDEGAADELYYDEAPPAPAPRQKKAGGKGAPKKKKKKKSGAMAVLTWIGRILAILLATVLMFVAFVAGLIMVLTHGPSTDAQRLFVLSTNETSAIYFLPYWFMADDKVDEILHPAPVVVEPDTFVEIGYEEDAAESESGQSLVQITEESVTDELEIIDIRKSGFKGKLMIIHDPSRVVIGSLDYFGTYGLRLTDFIAKYNAVAGTNAGGFYDPDGQGEGGIPDGLVIRDGAIAFGNAGTYYIDVIGFDADHYLHVGDMTGQQALDLGIVNAVSFAQGPVLIENGVKRTGLGGGVNPRTCIGQRDDGAILLLVIEGRHADSFGATYDELADLMEEYGAINAGNLDGGSSSALYYNGEQITRGSSVIGSRPMPTAILVLPGGDDQ